MKTTKNDGDVTTPMIDTPGYKGPDRRKRRLKSGAFPTSVRLRFDNKGRSLWEAVTEDSQRRLDDGTVSLLTALNDDSAAPKATDAPPREDTVMRRMIVAKSGDVE